MPDQFSRTEMLLGAKALARLKAAHVAVFGIGGVGGYAAEALARSGVGAFDLIDKDTVDITNLNRQIIATLNTVGRPKAEVMAERIKSINPDAQVYARSVFFLPETAGEFDFTSYDYVIDAVDTVTAKIALVLAAQAAHVPVISSMGAGNKINPSLFRCADIYATSVDPLARVMRQELKKRGVKALKTVYSAEPPLKLHKDAPKENLPEKAKGRTAPASCAFCPAAAGLLIASVVVRDLIGWESGRDKP